MYTLFMSATQQHLADLNANYFGLLAETTKEQKSQPSCHAMKSISYRPSAPFFRPLTSTSPQRPPACSSVVQYTEKGKGRDS
jgi:hypothetical protein